MSKNLLGKSLIPTGETCSQVIGVENEKERTPKTFLYEIIFSFKRHFLLYFNVQTPKDHMLYAEREEK